MSSFVEVTIQVPVRSDEEAAKIIEAVYSGMAADVLRMGVLYGFNSVGPAASSVSSAVPISGGYNAPVKQTDKSPVIKMQAEPAVKRQGDPGAKKQVGLASKPLNKGLAGRKRMGRA